MSETQAKLFWGDGEHEDEGPQDFMNGIEHSFFGKAQLTNSNRLCQFPCYLKAGLAAKLWWNNLPATQNDTWAHLQSSFEAQWPKKPPLTRSPAEKREMLKAATLSNADPGKRVKLSGVEEFTHIVWADKLEQLANTVPDTSGLLIVGVCCGMPTALKPYVSLGHTLWLAFFNAIQAVLLVQIKDKQEREKDLQTVRDNIQRIKHGTPSKALGKAFCSVNIGTPIPTP
jgi:hypothetical protein